MTTEEFVTFFQDKKRHVTFGGKIVASGVVPEGVDTQDKRVVYIVKECARANGIEVPQSPT